MELKIDLQQLFVNVQDEDGMQTGEWGKSAFD